MLPWLISPTKCCFWKGKEEEEKSFPAKRKEYKNKLKLWFNYWVICNDDCNCDCNYFWKYRDCDCNHDYFLRDIKMDRMRIGRRRRWSKREKNLLVSSPSSLFPLLLFPEKWRRHSGMQPLMAKWKR